jgi:hypothetical protein
MFVELMDFAENHVILSLIILAATVFISYKLILKYFRWIEETTGYYPLNGINIVLLVASIGLPVVNAIRVNEQVPSFLDLILFLIPCAILVVMNLKIKNPLHIVFVSLLQIIFSLIIIIVLIASLAFASILGGGSSQTTANNRTNKNWSDGTNQSWSGHEYDNQRANELGFNTVQEAIDAGYAYDGTRNQ